MISYTKKQRKEIYLKAAELIYYKMCDFSCYALYCADGGSYKFKGSATRHYCNILDEFALFEPKVCEDKMGLWFRSGDDESRIMCLLLCAEMTND